MTAGRGACLQVIRLKGALNEKEMELIELREQHMQLVVSYKELLAVAVNSSGIRTATSVAEQYTACTACPAARHIWCKAKNVAASGCQVMQWSDGLMLLYCCRLGVKRPVPTGKLLLTPKTVLLHSWKKHWPAGSEHL